MFLSGNGGTISDPAAVPAAVIQGSARLPLSFLMGSFWDHSLFAVTRQQERVRLPSNPAELAELGPVSTPPSAEVNL